MSIGRKSMYGDMTESEINLVFNHVGNYKGWYCVETGCGLVVMQKNGDQISAYRGDEVKNWIYECWLELKTKIDLLEK